MSDRRARPPSGSPVREALIVAGGQGTRLRPLTDELPKPLLPFCGAPFLEGVIRRLAAAGVARTLLVVGADTGPFDVLKEPAARVGVEVDIVPEPQPLDTAGGARAVADRLAGPVFVLNGDILSDVDLVALARAHVERGADATICLHRVADTSSFGVAVLDGDRIVAFVEKPPPGTLPGHDTINAGTYVVHPDVLLAHPAGRLSFERDVFPSLVARGGHLSGFVWDGVFADLGTPARYRAGHRLVLDGRLDWPTLADLPQREPRVWLAADADVAGDARLVPPVVVLADAALAEGATVGPHAVVGRGARIGAGATVADSVLHDGVRIAAGVSVAGLVAGRDAYVGPGARLGVGVVLGAATTVRAGEALPDGACRPAPL